MPWQYFKNKLPIWHDHPLKISKAKRATFVPLVMVSRKKWKALPNNDEEPMELPVKWVRHVQTFTESCSTREECIRIVQDLQTKHMREGLSDINYNFLIGGDGSVYDGRGWELDSQRDFDTWDNVESECLDIAYIGSYDQFGDTVPKNMIEQSKSLILYGLDKKYIHCCFESIPFDTEKMN